MADASLLPTTRHLRNPLTSDAAPRAADDAMTGLLSTCVVCGAELATKACARCKTLYCSPHCQQEHWNTGHKRMCKKIQRAGGAEQFHADAKFKEAADAAVASCAAEGVPQDAECFICRSSIEGKGIVSGCACHGGMGLAHVACLVRQGEVSVKEEEEWGTGEGIEKWWKCFDCGQKFHGAVKLALGWACWKTYLGRPDTAWIRCTSMQILGGALLDSSLGEEALTVFEANLALVRRYWSHDEAVVLSVQTNIAVCLSGLERDDEALALKRGIYAKEVATLGVSHKNTILDGNNIAGTMLDLQLWDEAKAFIRDQLLPTAQTSLGPDDDLTLLLNQNLAIALRNDPGHTRNDLRLNQHHPGAASTRPVFISTQATICSKPRQSCRT